MTQAGKRYPSYDKKHRDMRAKRDAEWDAKRAAASNPTAGDDDKCDDCGSAYPCKCCEWCEMYPCECVDDETGEPYDAEQRLLDKIEMHGKPFSEIRKELTRSAPASDSGRGDSGAARLWLQTPIRFEDNEFLDATGARVLAVGSGGIDPRFAALIVQSVNSFETMRDALVTIAAGYGEPISARIATAALADLQHSKPLRGRERD